VGIFLRFVPNLFVAALSAEIPQSSMSSFEDVESPQKRVKLSSEIQTLMEAESANLPTAAALPTTPPQGRAAHAAKEAEVGITDYVSREPSGFEGVLKKRYTDFLVNEILPNGKVVHLQKLRSAAVNQPSENSQAIVSSIQNGTGAPSAGIVGPSTVISPPVATTENRRSDEAKPEQPKDQPVEGSSPVSPLTGFSHLS